MAKLAPQRYSTRVRKPPDFDDFWKDVLNQASQVPLGAEVVPEPLRSTEEVEVFQVFYTSLDRVQVAGWYSLPRQRKGPLPAILQLPGYIMEPPIPKNWAKKGYAAFTAAPRGKLRSNHQFNPGYPGLLTYSMLDRNTYSYRGFYVDAWRAIDFFLGREEVDSARIGLTGSSQGGGLTIVTAAMRPEVAAASASAPYLCGFVDAIALTHTYPYQEIDDYLRLYPERREAVEETLAYFDSINFADKIQCPIIVNLGLQDNVCPPETGFAMFSAIGSSDKKLYSYDGHGHDAGRYQHMAIVDEFFARHLGLEA